MAEQVLSDIKVLDLTWYIAGPYCTKLLADYGADVIKIERPSEGDPARRMGPFFKDDPHPEKSGLFLHLNTNKKGITLNLKSATGKKIFKELVKDVDILVESFSPGVMERLGLGYETLERLNPKLVMTSISNFGQTGPYRDYKGSEIVLMAFSGDMLSHGKFGREPLKAGATLVQAQGGLGAATATIIGWYGSRYKGVGQHLDISLHDNYGYCAVKGHSHLLGYSYDGTITVPESVAGGYPWGAQPCKDGFFSIAAGGARNFPRMAKMLGRPELVEKYGSVAAQADGALKDEFLATVLWPWMAERTKWELLWEAQKVKVFCAPINTTQDALADPHFRARELFVEIEHPVTGRLTYPGAPVKMDKGWQIRSPAPLLGQHNEEVLGKLGYTKEDLVRLREQGVI